MAPADTLSCQDDMDTFLDNTNVQLLSSDAFDRQICTINVALADKIKIYHPMIHLPSKLSTKWRRSSPYLTDQKPRIGPLVMDTSTSKPTSTFLRSLIMNWSLPPTTSLRASMAAICAPLCSFQNIIDGQAFLSMSGNTSLAAWSAKHIRCSSTLQS